jgi:predicted transcriptional regulator
MASERLTITLPQRMAKELRSRARQTKQPVSRLVAQALKQQEDERIRQSMIEGYKASAEESRRIAEEFWPVLGETLPDD